MSETAFSSNPLLGAAGQFPDFAAIRPEHVLPAIRQRMNEYRAALDAVLDAGHNDFDRLMGTWERVDEALSRCFAPVSHLHNVCDSEELRAVYGDAEAELADFSASIGQDRRLCGAVKSLHAAPEYAALPATARKLVEDALLDFRLAGVDLPEAGRERFRAIASELSRLATDFEQAVLDATEAFHIDLGEGDPRLAGLSPIALDMLRQNAREAGVDGLRIGLQPPVYQAVMTEASDRGLRQELYRAYQTRASDQGPDAGRFDNSERIRAILALRQEAAQLLGFAHAAEESLATKMAGSTTQVLGFLHDLVQRARPVAARERDELAEFARVHLDLPDLQAWDLAYAAEQLRRQRFDLSDEELKPYFPLPRVLQGFFEIAGALFGIRFVARPGLPLWHADAQAYDVLDAQGQAFAQVLIDFHSRSGKRGGAWMDVCQRRFALAGSSQRPIAFLTCNFARPDGDRPSLLTHDDVLTLFHEFGHGLHHLLTRIDFPSLSGIEGVEWDAVELPSQFLENFAWSRAALDRISAHWQSGEPLPDALHQRMLAARHFHAGLFLVRQLEFALFDFRIHIDASAEVLDVLNAVRQEVAVIQPPEWQRFPHAFTHIFSGGYAAGYYSYLWAEVLSADAFEAFPSEQSFDAATGARFRREVLEVGGSRPALDSFVAFRGREPDPSALLRSYGLVSA